LIRGARSQARAGPAWRRRSCGGDRRVDLLGRRQAQVGQRLLGRRVLDREPWTLAFDLLARDQQPRLHRKRL
jgi:hypothetical protein